MNLTPDQLTDILQEVGIAFRHDHPSAVHQGEPGIYYGFDNPDIDLTERIAKAAELINARAVITRERFVLALEAGQLVYQPTGYTHHEIGLIEGEKVDENIDAALAALNTTTQGDTP